MKYIKFAIFLFVVVGAVVTLGSPVAKEEFMPQGNPALNKVEKREAPADHCCVVCRRSCTCCYA